MKCEKCNEREATFFYSSNYNGKKQEKRLCHDCAREEGFGEMLRPGAMFDSAFDSMFSDFFSPARSFFSLPSFDMFGGFGRSIMAPSLPKLRIVLSEPSAPTEAKPKTEVDDEAKAIRERDALKAQLEEAVKAENYEEAIVLRDKLRELEK